jgi:hypothetical protein
MNVPLSVLREVHSNVSPYLYHVWERISENVSDFQHLHSLASGIRAAEPHSPDFVGSVGTWAVPQVTKKPTKSGECRRREPALKS